MQTPFKTSVALGRVAAVVALASCPSLHAQSPPILEDEPPLNPAPASLPTLQRIVRQFDFNDADVAPDALPRHFYRYIAPSEGFPPFGSMRIVGLDGGTTGHGRGSPHDAPFFNGALLFELVGGSMSARLGTSVIPVLPMADYAVSVRVRTDGLRHARARLVAWLHDVAGNPIPRSMVQSRPANTVGEWETLSVELRGDFADAADLVLELQLVQPSRYDAAATNVHMPKVEDIDGRAWFDDLTVLHLPRVTLSLAQTGNVTRLSDPPQLRIMVSELSSERLLARLRVLNIDGRVVFDSSYPAPRGSQPGVIRVPVRECGWYRAVLDVTSQSNLTRRSSLDFVVIPDQEAPHGEGRTRLAVVLAEAPTDLMPALSNLVDLLDVDAALVPVWHRTSGTSADQLRQLARKQLIEDLLGRGLELVFWLNVVPDELGRLLNLESDQVIGALATEPRLWRPYLDDLLVNFGLEVNRWHIGAHASASAMRVDNLKTIVENATRSFADFVPDSTMYTSWQAEIEPNASEQLPAYAIVIPSQVQPKGVELYVEPWLGQGRDIFATLERLPTDRYSPRHRVSDMMLRALHAWRARLPIIAIDQPWSYTMDRQLLVMPDPCFGPWRTLAQQLSGREYAGELTLAHGIHCWILAGRSAERHAVVAWADAASPGPAHSMTTQLASTPVTVVDAFGNTSTISPVNGLHTVDLNDLPVFIEGVDLELVQFRGALAIEPGFVPAISKVHEHAIVLRNPWDVAVSGVIRLRSEDEWQLSPAVQDFAIRPGAEVRLPLTIVPQRNILAGRKQVNAEITLTADRPYRLKTFTHLDVGLAEIDLAASWSIARNQQTGADDLIVTQAVTNRGTRVINLSVFVQASNIGQNRRTITGLEPGDTAVRSFRIPNGASLLAGQQLRVGVSETDGAARLNRLLTISPRTRGPAHAAAAE